MVFFIERFRRSFHGRGYKSRKYKFFSFHHREACKSLARFKSIGCHRTRRPFNAIKRFSWFSGVAFWWKFIFCGNLFQRRGLQELRCEISFVDCVSKHLKSILQVNKKLRVLFGKSRLQNVSHKKQFFWFLPYNSEFFFGILWLVYVNPLVAGSIEKLVAQGSSLSFRDVYVFFAQLSAENMESWIIISLGTPSALFFSLLLIFIACKWEWESWVILKIWSSHIVSVGAGRFNFRPINHLIHLVFDVSMESPRGSVKLAKGAVFDCSACFFGIRALQSKGIGPRFSNSCFSSQFCSRPIMIFLIDIFSRMFLTSRENIPELQALVFVKCFEGLIPMSFYLPLASKVLGVSAVSLR